MSNLDSELLSTVSKQCFFRHQPQPLVDLLNRRGIVGRQAEVFWTYFHWGFQSGSFSCQLSSAYVAELLFTDVRTVQRANERLQDAGFISRERAKRGRGTHLEAPAITTITIPDEEARLMLIDAPQRGGTPDRVTSGAADIVPAKKLKEFTAVNSSPSDSVGRNESQSPSPSPATVSKQSPKPQSSPANDLSVIKAGLPEKVRRFHDVCMVKASPGAFRRVLDELGNISESDIEALLLPLRKARDLKERELSEVQKRRPPSKPDSKIEARPVRTEKRPQDPRPIPTTVVRLINQRLNATGIEKTKSNKSLSELAHEIIYSITIGTMRGVDVMHAINATLKLITTKKWTRPRGMPHGWCFDHVLAGTA